MNIYDEDQAVKYILSRISDQTISRDDILNIIDCIFDYYDENGDLDLDFDEVTPDETDDSAAICSFVEKSLEDYGFESRLIAEIVNAELDYEASLLD